MIKKIKEYFQGVRAEVKKITWPSKKEVRNHTIIVIVSIGVLMLIFGGMDMIFSKILEVFISRS